MNEDLTMFCVWPWVNMVASILVKSKVILFGNKLRLGRLDGDPMIVSTDNILKRVDSKKFRIIYI